MRIQLLLIINSMTEKLTAMGKIKPVLLFIKTFLKELTFIERLDNRIIIFHSDDVKYDHVLSCFAFL